MTSVKADRALIERANKRFQTTVAAMGDVYNGDGSHGIRGNARERIAMQTAISLNADKRVLREMIAGVVENSTRRNANSAPDLAHSMYSLLFEALNIGWLIRDEQLIAEAQEAAAYEQPCADCPVDQVTLRAVGAKFCPQCGVIRCLHEERLVVEVDGD